MKYLIDTSAWIEYLEGSEIGEEVNKILDNKNNEIFIIDLIIAETISKVKRKKRDVDSAFRITNNAKIINIDSLTAKEAGLLHAQEKQKNESFSITDALIIKTAEKINVKILTKDPHFKSFKEAIIL